MLAVGLLSEADLLLQRMKQEVDLIVAGERKLQELLIWVKRSSSYPSISIQSEFKQVAVRGFYLAFAYNIAIINTQKKSRENFSARLLEPPLYHLLDSKFTVPLAKSAIRTGIFLYFAGRSARSRHYDPKFAIELANQSISPQLLSLLLPAEQQKRLLELKVGIPDLQKQQKFQLWWQENSQCWTEPLNNLINQCSNLSHNFRLSNYQEELFKQYYQANVFLLECLNSDCYVSRKTREKIENNLLLPWADTEDIQDVLVG